MSKIHSGYLEDILDVTKFDTIVKEVCAAIRKHAPKAQAVAFRGASGMLIGMAVCSRLKLPPIMVRKGEKSHTSRKAEGAVEEQNIVIVDDCKSSGDTIRSILSDIHKERINLTGEPGSLVCLGAFFYTYEINSVYQYAPVDWRKQEIVCRGTKKS